MYVKAMLGDKGFGTYSVSPDDTVLTVLQLFRKKKIGFAAVINPNGKVLGGVSERDVCLAMSIAESAGRHTAVRDVMTKDVMFCSPKDNLVKIMALMTEKKNRHVLVYDGDNLSGVISIGDVVKHRLDEILREEQELLRYVEGTGYSYTSSLQSSEQL